MFDAPVRCVPAACDGGDRRDEGSVPLDVTTFWLRVRSFHTPDCIHRSGCMDWVSGSRLPPTH